MARLTSDIVWLVEQDVTTADGSVARALVPQVYLRVMPGDLDTNGALLAGADVDIKLRGDWSAAAPSPAASWSASMPATSAMWVVARSAASRWA